ncbi:hypothetical protein LUZ60_000390 [Juncus effusus]|nr:hypothetical protein LUZ60_000390 [Juncus effusus]
MRLVRTESVKNSNKSMEKNLSSLVALPLITALAPIESKNSKPTSCSTECPAEEQEGTEKSPVLIIKEKKSVFLKDYKPLWGCNSICGMRDEMEDSFIAVPSFSNVPLFMLTQSSVIDGIQDLNSHKIPLHFFGVYDGHGGSQVAEYCKERIHMAIKETLQNIVLKDGIDFKKEWERVLVEGFTKVDEETEVMIPSETVGSTAVISIVCSSHIIVANCGDSRAVLSRGKLAVPLSVDHKPEREEEFARIEAEGGKVIWWNGYRVLGVLAMSRSIGDRYLKPWIIPVPDVTIIPRAKDDDFLILASDGLWDAISNQEACDLARKKIISWHKKNDVILENESCQDPATQLAAESLTKLALQRGSKDNITVMVMDLKSKWKLKNKP